MEVLEIICLVLYQIGLISLGFALGYDIHKKEATKHQPNFDDLFEDMREATSEEKESVNEYIKSISKSTGINFYDIIE